MVPDIFIQNNPWHIAQTVNTHVKTPHDAVPILDKMGDIVKTHINNGKYNKVLAITLLNDDLQFRNWDITKGEDSPVSILNTYVNSYGSSILIDTLDTVKRSIVEKHPVLCELFAIAIHEKWIYNECTERHWHIIHKMCHMMVIYDALVKHAIKSKEWIYLVIDHYSKIKWEKFNTIKEYIRKTNAFSFIKGESVNWCLFQFFKMCVVKYDTTKDNTTHKLLLNKLGKTIKIGLDINIYEAVSVDRVLQNSQNATAAVKGLLGTTTGSATISEQDTMQIDVGQQWASLYVAWNLCFICKFSNAHMLYAKLLHPYTLDAPPEDFVYRRAISLLFAVQGFLINQLNNVESPPSFPSAVKMQTTLATLNEKYAKEMVKINPHPTKNPLLKIKTLHYNIRQITDTSPLMHILSRTTYRPPSIDTICKNVLPSSVSYTQKLKAITGGKKKNKTERAKKNVHVKII